MNRSMFARPLGLALAAGLFALLTSCASTKKDTPRMESARVLDKTQYEEVYVTGSNIPVLVPKGPNTVQRLPTISPVKTISGDAFRDAMRPGRTPVRR
jgi:hypothetical protein